MITRRVAAALVVLVAAGCSRDARTSAHPAPVAVHTARQTVVVDAAGPCPASLGAAGDVRNDVAGLDHDLVPTRWQPTAGLVCAYGPSGSRALRLSTRAAGVLARAVAGVSLAEPRGAFSCPAQVTGADTVIALGDERRTVDLWYSTTGCQTLDNGTIEAFAITNPSFYDGFVSTFDRLTKDR